VKGILMLHQNSQKNFCCPNGIAIVVVIVTGRCCIVDVAAAFFDCAKEADKGVPSSSSAAISAVPSLFHPPLPPPPTPCQCHCRCLRPARECRCIGIVAIVVIPRWSTPLPATRSRKGTSRCCAHHPIQSLLLSS